ncbi:MAG: hypothetical protein AMJ53_00770 [Gammaproteobacteria bacterium SG8_11]|nr:MAG: hypothetical protein AMJ53_00770 [Gammaproteobacteria bacterium SG8_11]
METQLLRDQQIFPSKEVLENELGRSYLAFEELTKRLSDVKYGLTIEWRFYKDGKAWLCKVCHKKKTIFWLSVWDKYFKTTFYFTEKSGKGINELNIEEELKESFSRSKAIGRLIPLTININEKEQVKDVIKLVDYKKSLK